jgi:hypothetical protein
VLVSFPERAHLLSGLTLRASHATPGPAPRTRSTRNCGTFCGLPAECHRAGRAGRRQVSERGAENDQQWHDLVRVFLDGARAAAALGHAPERLTLEVEPGVTMAES